MDESQPAYHSIKIIILIATVTLLLSLLSPNPIYSSGMGFAPVQKGVCYVTWDKNRFATKYSDRSLEKLHALGVDYIAVIITHYQENLYSTRIQPTENSPTDSSIEHVINKAHSLGIKVMLKPHVDLINTQDDTYWRADIGFAREKDWQDWFKEYKRFITKYARMAAKLNVEMFCIGTELSFTTQKNDLWLREIINPIRHIYPGKLIYAANWDNYTNVDFWDELDYIGIDAYFPLTYHTEPSVNDLKRGWQKWTREIRSWHKTVNKPIIFTEIGYPSTPHAPITPWKGGTIGNADPEIQARCYTAFFETVWGADWLKGVYWWKWDTSVHAGGKHNRQFTPQNKPAQRIIEAHYKGFSTGSTYAKAE